MKSKNEMNKSMHVNDYVNDQDSDAAQAQQPRFGKSCSSLSRSRMIEENINDVNAE
jgi:hypothetical protein